ncbi:Uncharacterized protein BP5553_09776 [Venustampulla echinocandica]|uniref:Alpha/beta hydrolase fold-3 domain-containing protein n=1 Tax=Venustampulla echinocandica TaxID=2656787 RepID=A0A370TAP6_9HELO|nr:Uncharacterized protein BP5553_09776 [Venustampulla echinocandica]RDL30987.1 Uncharacterized protein BP5553_09776 [Venustampulla echinocandica]
MPYSKYQGPSSEWTDFIHTTSLPVPSPSSASQTPEQLRAATNTARLQASEEDLQITGLRDKVSWQDHCILTRDYENILARVYKPKNMPLETLLPVYLYFHGGGYIFGTLDTEDASCCRIVAASPTPGVIVVNVNYRHTPEFKHPTQFNDAWDSFQWLSMHITSLGGDPNQVVIGGISAGAGLAASIVLRENTRLQQSQTLAKLNIRGQLLCIPWLVHPDRHPLATNQNASLKQNTDAPVLPMSLLKLFTDLLSIKDPADPLFNVALAAEGSLKGMPRATFLIAGQDLLRDDGLLYADRLGKIG